MLAKKTFNDPKIRWSTAVLYKKVQKKVQKKIKYICDLKRHLTDLKF